MSNWTKLRFKILAVFSLIFFFVVGLLKQILSYLFTVIILILIFSSISYASTWQDVLTAYYSAKVEYPNQKIWIEEITDGYRLWRRPSNISFVYYKTIIINRNAVTVTVPGSAARVCEGKAGQNPIQSLNLGDIYYIGGQGTRESKYCDGSTVTSNSADAYSESVSNPCWFDILYSSVKCKADDVLLQEFFDIIPNCNVLSMQVGSFVYGGDASKGCDCTPGGTVYADNSFGNCKYTIITGDPAVSPPKLSGDLPGLTVLNNTTTSPPVTNPDGSTTTITTNTFPDSSQDVKTSNTVTNLDGTSTTIIITERIVGGVSLGTTGTSTTTKYADNSSRTVATNSTGTTATTLSGGAVNQTQTTYSSGLSVTNATGGSSSGNTATSGGGTGTGGGGGGTGGTGGSGTVTVDPETASAVVPIASEKPAYIDSRLAGAEGKTFGDFGNLFTDFSNGVKSTSLFSRFNFNDFSNSISGASSSPTQSINFGRFGSHDVDLSTYGSSFYIIKGIMLILASYLATRIVILKR